MSGAIFWPISKNLNIPLVVHFHGQYAYRHSTLGKYAEMYKPMFDYASSIVSVSTDMTRQLISLGAPKEKIVYNCYGVDLAYFLLPKDTIREQRFLYVGRFVDKKAPLLVIRAFEIALQHFPEAKLTMAGEGYPLEMC